MEPQEDEVATFAVPLSHDFYYEMRDGVPVIVAP